MSNSYCCHGNSTEPSSVTSKGFERELTTNRLGEHLRTISSSQLVKSETNRKKTNKVEEIRKEKSI